MKWMRAVVMMLLFLALLLGSASCATNESHTQGSSSTGNTNSTPPRPSPKQFTISDVTTSDITASSITIVWSTNAPSTSEVEYGLTTDYGFATSLDLKLVTRHSVKVTGLGPHTYHYRARSVDVDGSGNVALSSDYSVTMPGTKPIAANVSVYCIGDSITAGGCGGAVSYVLGLQSLLNTLPGANWNVYNKGIGGQTTTQMLARFTTDIIDHPNSSLPCEYVFILGGINDLSEGYSVASVESDLQQMYTLAHNAGIKVVALYLTPFQNSSTCRAINTWIQGSALHVDYIVDLWTALQDPAHPGYLNPAYTDDPYGLHPNSAGEAVMAQTIFADVVWAS